MKKLFKSGALVLAAAVVMAFASCSNGSSSDDEELVYKTIVEQDVSFNGNLKQLVSAETFAKADVKSVRIEIRKYSKGNGPDAWITTTNNKEWDKETVKTEFSSYLNSPNTLIYTFSALNSKEYVSGGLYIAGDDGASANITISIGLTADALAALEEAEKLASNTEKTTKITGTSVTISGDNAEQAITPEQLANYNITAMTVSAKLTGSADGDWWAGITNPVWASLSWNANPAVEGYNYELIADSDLISDAKSNGIWIKANPGLTAEVKLTITYTE